MSQKTTNQKIKLSIGCTTLIVGVVATGLSLYRWFEGNTTVYLLGNYSKYICAFGGFLAAIIGLLIIKEVWHQTIGNEETVNGQP